MATLLPIRPDMPRSPMLESITIATMPAGQLAIGYAELAAATNVSERSLRSQYAGGYLPLGFVLGKRRLFLVGEILAYFEAGAPSREHWEAIKASEKRGRR